jgi:uncharacterized membrane protein required for colicin V production
VLLISFFSGYKNGLIVTIFRTAGYILGGVAGFAISVKVINMWSNNLAKVASAMILILLLATASQFILGKVGIRFRQVLFISPLKLLDSLIGAILATLRTVFIVYFISIILITIPWSIGNKYISNSQFYTYTDSHLSKVAVQLKTHSNKLFKEPN